MGTGAQALAFRFRRYCTENLINEAEKVAKATGIPVPIVFNQLIRQRRIDELTMETVRRVGEAVDVQDQAAGKADVASDQSITERWFHTFYEEVSKVEWLRRTCGRLSYGYWRMKYNAQARSPRTLRMMSAMSRLTARQFRRAVSVSIQLTTDRKHILDARIPAVSGKLGQNALQHEGLSYEVLINLTKNDLSTQITDVYIHTILLSCTHTHKTIPRYHSSTRLEGAKLTSCGIELLKIVDIEALPAFAKKAEGTFLSIRT